MVYNNVENALATGFLDTGAKALLPPHECGGSHHKDWAAAYRRSNLGSRSALRSEVRIREQPAFTLRAAMRASANEPRPSHTAVKAVATSASCSTNSASAPSIRSITMAISCFLRR